MKLKGPCQKANHFCDKKQYNEANFLEKIRLHFHLVYCHACRKYSQKNKKLSTMVEHASIHTITPIEKKVLQQRIEKHVNTPSD